MGKVKNKIYRRKNEFVVISYIEKQVRYGIPLWTLQRRGNQWMEKRNLWVK